MPEENDYVNIVMEVEVIVVVPKGATVTPEDVEKELRGAVLKGRYLSVSPHFREMDRRNGGY
jgi:hypothetical protein